MITDVLSYIVAFLIVGAMGWIGEFVLYALIPIVRHVKYLLPILRFIVGGISTFFSVYIVITVADLTFLRSSFLMVFIPWILQVYNDFNRISKVKRGISGARFILQSQLEGEIYNNKLDLWTERCDLFGIIIGFWWGIILFMKNQPFF